MSASNPANPAEVTRKKHQPFVPEGMEMKEFTPRAVILGLFMTVILGAANAYLGLRAGITIAATYPAAVIGMAVLRGMKGSILEENIARTSGTIGEGIAAGAIFTIPAFLISGVWPSFRPADAYWKSTALIMVGSVLGVLFISLVRKGMVEDPELPFPESVAAAEIHKAGRRGAQAAKYLFWNIGIGAVVYLLGSFGLFAVDKTFQFAVGSLGAQSGSFGRKYIECWRRQHIRRAERKSGLAGRRLHHRTAVGWNSIFRQCAGMGTPRSAHHLFKGPELVTYLPAGSTDDWTTMADAVWRNIVRPIAVGGMLVGSVYTLYRMKDSLAAGLGKAFGDLRRSAGDQPEVSRTERYMSFKTVFALIAVMFVLMCFLYIHVSNLLWPAILAAVVMLLVGFFFATVSGSLCGTIGSSNNPVSGITLSTLLIAALLMVSLGVSGKAGVAAVLGVAAVVCVSSSVAGELLQDFKVGYILGGTPRRIQAAELIAVVVASSIMYWPLYVLSKGMGFGSKALPAPQAGLMATLAQGIVGGNMPWPLIVVGMFLGVAMIMMQVRSPMLVAVGMYLPFETTCAIFVGGIFRSIGDRAARKRGFNAAQTARVENAGVLTASGLIAGEALMGLLWAALRASVWAPPKQPPQIFGEPLYLVGMVVLGLLAALMIFLPLTSAGDPSEPAPPTAIM